MAKFCNGVFSAVKPSAVTSFGVVKELRAILQRHFQLHPFKPIIKLGHGGTLDKFATGVLVIGVGTGCQELTHFLSDCDKSYQARIKFGIETDTLDPSGTIIRENVPYQHLTLEYIHSTLQQHFIGPQLQSPPIFSALKHNGKRLSDIARQHGIKSVPQKEQRPITIYSAEILGYPLTQSSNTTNSDLKKFPEESSEVDVVFNVSSGTYIRQIAADLATHLETAAHLSRLCRIRQGAFTLENSLQPSDWTAENILAKLSDYTSKKNPT